MEPKELLDKYLAGPSMLRAAIKGMTPEQMDASPIPGKWSTRQVICHIADFEPVYVDRMKRVIAEHEPTLFSGDPDVFAANLSYEKRDIEEELALIQACRSHMHRILRTVPAAAFQRRGNHSEAGPITLEKILSNIAGHVPHHIPFIEEKRKALGC